jgi:hypothetical protein
LNDAFEFSGYFTFAGLIFQRYSAATFALTLALFFTLLRPAIVSLVISSS